MARTYGQSFANAMALDAHDGTHHYSDAVLFEMLNHIGRRARGELSEPAQRSTRKVGHDRENEKFPARLLIKARLVAPASAVKSGTVAVEPGSQRMPQQSAWTSEDVAAALQDGVLRGRISGTAAMAALKIVTCER